MSSPGSVPKVLITLLESGVDPAIILDRDCKVLFYNQAFEELSSASPAELREAMSEGRRCSELLPLEICAQACLGSCARKAGHTIRVESKALSVDKTLAVTATPVAGLIIESFRDISAEVLRASELEQARSQLVLQEKMSSLGRLLAGIAHELANPINFIYGNIEFVEEYMHSLLRLVAFVDASSGLSPELRAEFDKRKSDISYEYLVQDSVKILRAIRTGAERTAAIVSDLKNFSRTSPGKTQALDVAAGIETTLNLIEPLLKERIEVRRCYADSLPKVVCNAGHINQVFMNLLSNAAQAIEGSGWIKVEIDTVQGNSQLQVVVSDSGSGVSEECKTRLSEPFFTTKEGGTGLGLWISKGIVERHGGTLSCESAPGQGASFRVRIPVTPAASLGETKAAGHYRG